MSIVSPHPITIRLSVVYEVKRGTRDDSPLDDRDEAKDTMVNVTGYDVLLAVPMRYNRLVLYVTVSSLQWCNPILTRTLLPTRLPIPHRCRRHVHQPPDTAASGLSLSSVLFAARLPSSVFHRPAAVCVGGGMVLLQLRFPFRSSVLLFIVTG